MDVFKDWKRRTHLRPKVARNYVCLPARECLCVKAALKCGAINTDTHIVFFEENRADYEQIHTVLQSLGFKNVDGFYGELSPEILRRGLSCLETKADIIWLDFCGELNRDTEIMIKIARAFMRKDGILATTFTSHTRQHINKRLNKDAAMYYDCVWHSPLHWEGRGIWQQSDTTQFTIEGTMVRICQYGLKPIRGIFYRSPNMNKKANMMMHTFKPI